MRDFKRILKNGCRTMLFFGILFVLLNVISSQMLEAVKANGKLLKDRNKSVAGIQREPKDTVDVLVLGDSLAYSAISPLQLWKEQGISSYICAQSGQQMPETYFMLKTALKCQTPKVVVLETNPLFRVQSDQEVWQTVLTEIGYYCFPVFRYHDIWKALVAKRNYGGNRYKGFFLHTKVNPYKGGDYMSKPGTRSGRTGISETSLYFLKKIKGLCEKKGIKLLLLSTPSPQNYNLSTHQALADYSNSQGLPYLEMNLLLDEIGINWKVDSLDNGDHLNLSGACRVTEYLGNYLKANYELADHRGERAYGKWENKAEQYEQLVKEKLEKIREPQKISGRSERK